MPWCICGSQRTNSLIPRVFPWQLTLTQGDGLGSRHFCFLSHLLAIPLVVGFKLCSLILSSSQSLYLGIVYYVWQKWYPEFMEQHLGISFVKASSNTLSPWIPLSVWPHALFSDFFFYQQGLRFWLSLNSS